MSNTYERQHRGRMVKEIIVALTKSGMSYPQTDTWVARHLNSSPWSAERWRSGTTMPTGDRWTAFQGIHEQLVKGGKDPSEVSVPKPQIVSRAKTGRYPQNGAVKGKKLARKTVVSSKPAPTVHSASVEFVKVLSATMTLTELDEIHRLTGELIVGKARG